MSRISICCDEPMVELGNLLSRDPNVCASCSSLADGMEEEVRESNAPLGGRAEGHGAATSAVIPTALRAAERSRGTTPRSQPLSRGNPEAGFAKCQQLAVTSASLPKQGSENLIGDWYCQSRGVCGSVLI
jgi:hypothetical protein